jgi:acyl dehydratase
MTYWRSCPECRIIAWVREIPSRREHPTAQAYLVGREKIREFAAAIGDDSAVYRDPAAARALGYADVVAPPTFPVVVAQQAVQLVLAGEDFGVDLTRMVHTRLELVYTRPVVAGDELATRATIDRADEIDDKLMLRIRCDIGTLLGERVVTAFVSLIVPRAGSGM